MSMSSEEILLNCKKHFDLIKTDIKTLLKYTEELLQQCIEIDNSNFYQKKIEELISRVKEEIRDIDNMEKKVSDFKNDIHVEIEKYNEIQKFAEKKREQIAKLKVSIHTFRKDVVQKEQEMIKKNLTISLQKNSADFRNEIINKQIDFESKVLAKKFWNENEPTLINMSNDDILKSVSNYILETKSSTKHIVQTMVKQTIDLYNNDQDIVAAIQDDVRLLLSNANEQNIFEEGQKFFKNSAKKAENEAIRKDAIKKIVNSIRNVGYIVTEKNIRKIKEKNLILIYGEKPTGETASFSVRLDGSFVYNYEGFEGHEHDADADAFLQELHREGLQTAGAFEKQYREPKFTTKKQKLLANMKKIQKK